MATSAPVKTANGFAGLRDITAADVPAIVDYWVLTPDQHLTSMRVDRQRIGTQEDIYRRFANAIRTGHAQQSNIALAITLNDRLVGYSLLNRYSDDVNYSKLAHHRAEPARQRTLVRPVSASDQGLF
jgi:hypothetical protein